MYNIVFTRARCPYIQNTAHGGEREPSAALALSGPAERARRAEPSRRERESGVERSGGRDGGEEAKQQRNAD